MAHLLGGMCWVSVRMSDELGNGADDFAHWWFVDAKI
jgi:hypothetical protein